MIGERHDGDPGPPLRVEELSTSNRDAAIVLARQAWDRPTATAYFSWRYGNAASGQLGALALAGDRCVATMFALRRMYRTPSGVCEALEPFEWHADPAWRARGAGLRVVRHWMAEERPLIALGGTAAAVQLFARLRWSPLCVAETYLLSLSGRSLRARGRSRALAAVFDAVLRHYFIPRRRRGAVELRVVLEPGDRAREIAQSQQRFEWMRQPDPLSWSWLSSAPPVVGRFIAYHLVVDGEVVGWATARVHRTGGVTVGQIQECFLRDDARRHYADALREICVTLAESRVDAIQCTTSCPDTITALRELRFRHDADDQVVAWRGGRPVLAGPALLDAGHADRAFFPLPTAAEAHASNGSPD